MKYFLYCRKSTEAEDRQVMSIDSQRAELRRAFGAHNDVEIVAEFEEAKSAKAPGRPIFAQMIARIEAGEAVGIVAWAPDRLARNSIDGGHVVYLLDRGVLRDLKFATYTFENNSQGKFMLNIMFGYSKYYSDNLSEVVKRGNRTKVERGWRPGAAPTGYLNDPRTKTIVLDPARFPQVQKLFGLVLAGHSAKGAGRIARDVWAMTTVPSRRGGGSGRLVSYSTVHHILTNPFYAGTVIWRGETYEGAHEPAVSHRQFDEVQRLLASGRPERPQKHAFTYRGLLRCGACGSGVTAERKTNRYGSTYVYYHCARPKLGPPCKEGCIEEGVLEAELSAFFDTVALHPEVGRVLTKMLLALEADAAAIVASERSELEAKGADLERQLKTLTDLRVRELIDDAEFVAERRRLMSEAAETRLALQSSRTVNAGIEPGLALIRLSSSLGFSFREGDAALKRDLVRIVGSNPTLKGRKLSIQAAKPFQLLAEMGGIPSRLGYSGGVRIRRRPDDTLRAFIASVLRMEDVHRLPAVAARVPAQLASSKVPQVPDVRRAA